MIKGVLFDLDGTLTNRQRMLYYFNRDLHRYFFNRQHPTSFEYETVIQNMMLYDMFGLGENSLARELMAEHYGMDYDKYQKYANVFGSTFAEYTVLKPEAIPVLDELLKRGYKIGVISNGEKEYQRRKAEVTGLNDYFKDCYVVSEELQANDINIKKPMKEIYEYAADKLGLKCEECAYVGDNFSGDIKGAFNSGMLPIWMWTDDEWGCKSDVIRIFNLWDLFKYLGVRDDD